MKGEPVMCPVDQHCLQWARRYIGSCLCSTRHGFSVGLGVVSVVSWCVAEIPQIITNYRKKSAEGLSILFLMTWIVGDFFNLFGCMLEPETLPTQYYTAVLYAVTTVILSLQAVYYDHIYPRLKSNKRRQEAVQAEAAERRERNNDSDTEKGSYGQRCGVPPSSTIHVVSSSPSSYDELYFMSARSLSVSRTPPAGSFLGPRSPLLDIEQRWFREPLLGEGRSPKSGTPKIKAMLCVVSLMTFLVGSHNHLQAERLENNSARRNPTGGIVLQVGRQLLEATGSSAHDNIAAGYSAIGSILGWGMAAIYLGGRLPQIYLNIKRGHTEGLNPLMFVFAVIGNTTYVASILVNSLNWLKIKPNLPWLVDAGGCVILDAFILIQFVYFRYRPRNEVEKYVS
ncbi:seven transmembrane protein 1-like [Salvia miltiorrhiza]|uniref:seven transmembrane protein 1-like n=1 Tax=Salvia miltiorrhiza TaxID=226208 RepID=UPI0025AC9913|nr:seven transmembrane protein 1-like [Salvia miltiorrhiza]XP_057785321.1 seven transmembrane protein 1-like [Salvia miltiorrhiza]XP_057786733.1 seven transmembrane protein 1-like [Salvia miltiorrhiza]XP_057786739.1 seven transmembrane protein 1-like [Salvia miltiorrhiza]